jgi:putative membrane protein
MTMMTRPVAKTSLLAGLLLTAATAIPAAGQTSQGAPAAAQSRPAAMARQVTDADFVTKVAISDMFEIESSRLALLQSQDTDVKAFAQKMITDHGKSTERLKGVVGQSGAPAQMPTQLDADHQQKLTRLKATSGKSFDAAYLQMQREGHEQAVALFAAYSKTGGNGALKAFANEVLPTIQMHHQQVQKLD